MSRYLALPHLAATIAICIGGTARAQSAKEPDFVAWTDTCVSAWGPTAAERRFDEIGWSTEISAALALANEHQRPVFLFTHDGRMGVGRQ